MSLTDKITLLIELLKINPRGQWRNEQFLAFTPEQLFDTYNFPKEFEFSKNFKKKFYNLSLLNLIHGGMLVQDLEKIRDGNFSDIRMKSEILFKGDILKEYGIKHMHYFYINGKMIELINIAKKNPNLGEDGKKLIQFYDTKNYNTGEWIIYKEHDSKLYFIDIASHGEDLSIKDVIETKIKAEYSFLFKN